MNVTAEFSEAVQDFKHMKDQFSGRFRGVWRIRKIVVFLREKLYRPVRPKKMVKRIFRAAKKNPYTDFGHNTKRFLSSCIVRINDYDWNAYYGLHQHEMEGLLAREMIRQSADNSHVSVSMALRVELRHDSSVRKGTMAVDLGEGVVPDMLGADGSSEDDASAAARDKDASLHMEKTVSFATSSFAFPHARTQLFSSEQRKSNTGGESGFIKTVMPVYQPQTGGESHGESGSNSSYTTSSVPKARLENAEGGCWRVHSADIIGVKRGKPGVPVPGIVLEKADYYYVSQNQGRFTFEQGSWYFTHMGRSSSRIQHPDGLEVELSSESGVKCPIEHGARIMFAGNAPVLTFIEG